MREMVPKWFRNRLAVRVSRAFFVCRLKSQKPAIFLAKTRVQTRKTQRLQKTKNGPAKGRFSNLVTRSRAKRRFSGHASPPAPRPPQPAIFLAFSRLVPPCPASSRHLPCVTQRESRYIRDAIRSSSSSRPITCGKGWIIYFCKISPSSAADLETIIL